MCNQAAGLSRYLAKVRESMVTQLKTLHSENGKGKSSGRSQHAVGALEYLVTFNVQEGFDKDISPATISSWIKQSVILCYELSDQEALTFHQVKAHDIRAFAASKAF